MPWGVKTEVSQREEFVLLASQEGANIAALCRRYGIHRDTGYKWLARFKAGGIRNLKNQTRRPHSSPHRTSKELEEAIVQLRHEHPDWGGRKLKAYLEDLGVKGLPTASTMTAILKRRGLLVPEESVKHKAFIRFEHEAPNLLWQMDFKGDFALAPGRCFPLTVLDDHSRFSICLKACSDQRTETVQLALTESFRRHGLPLRMTMDNGAPWGHDAEHRYTPLTVWLIRLGIRVSHSRPYHPQTQGKDERFHRTLKAELLNRQVFRNLDDCQQHFDRWRDMYNLKRPHQALGQIPPVRRYQPSPREFPEQLPPILYGPDDDVRRVQDKGLIYYRGQRFSIGKAFKGQQVALRPTERDGIVEIYYCTQRVADIDLRQNILL